MQYRISTLSLLATATAIILTGCQSEEVATEQKTLRPIQVFELAFPHRSHSEKFSGKVYSQNSADIAFRVPGYIDSVLVKPGDVVSKGQVLAELDTHDFLVSKKELEARLKEAESANILATLELKRIQKAVNYDAISSITLDRAKSGYERSLAAVEVVRQNLNKVDDSIGYTRLRAPFDGTVSKTKYEAFEQVQAGISVLTLHQPNKLEVRIDVPESLIHRFKPELTGEISWYGSAQSIAARVSDIETEPDLIRQTYSVNYTIEEQINKALFPGKHVMVKTNFVASAEEFCIPYSSVISQEGSSSVFVAKEQSENNYVSKKQVLITRLEGGDVCVRGSLQAGDKVVVSGAHYLNDGLQVGEISLRNREGT
ncbi:efflux RND transporter periplasmic adaptor subunit [Moritella sp. 5]|uniref:efflux RND transporter periplasmic adaptor subunit n=1 Tax=Moritella sp. 5 TaxID=2746231 RepID=UPI001BA9355E|nr:efflux RND transporter periplasmic adaptor subunit [Moritella sp. 5]QUM80401.1 efflux RND transporter periplasmic adaptor subunit [Moritella sp. 5]